MVPIQVGAHLLAREVRTLQFVGHPELRGCLDRPSRPAQFVAMHMDRVWHLRRLRGIRGGVGKRLVHPPAVLVGVRQVMPRAHVVGRRLERTLEKRDRCEHRSLAAIGGIRRRRQPSLQDQLDIVREGHKCRIERLAIGGELGGIAGRFFSGHLRRSRLDVVTFMRRHLRGHGSCQLDRLTRLGGFVHLTVGVAEADLRQREPGIAAQRLIERTRRFNPYIGVQVGKPLIVEALCVGRLRAGGVAGASDASAKGHRTFQQRLWHDGNDMARVLGSQTCEVGTEKEDGTNKEREALDDALGLPALHVVDSRLAQPSVSNLRLPSFLWPRS